MHLPRLLLLVWISVTTTLLVTRRVKAAAFISQKSIGRRLNILVRQIMSSASNHITTSASANDGESLKPSAASKNPEDILSEEERANLFQFLLRDLQVEGVPLLAVDADQIHTFQAAVWTTMTELLTASMTTMAAPSPSNELNNKNEGKACLIFEDIPMDDLRTFVDDFQILQTQERLMEQLPELVRFHISLVGKGVGPAILVAVGNPDNQNVDDDLFSAKPRAASEFKVTGAMKLFADRIVFWANSGFDRLLTTYRVCGFPDVCHVMSSFWTCICELQTTPSDELSSVVLMMPHVTDIKTVSKQSDETKQQHARFAAVAELISRSMCLYPGNDNFELLHFHPTYERDQIYPVDRPAHGHLPPSNWIRPVLKHCSADQTLSDEDLLAFDYQRRAPVTAVIILRASRDDTSTELDLGDGETVSITGIRAIARSIVSMARKGNYNLQRDLEKELSIMGRN